MVRMGNCLDQVGLWACLWGNYFDGSMMKEDPVYEEQYHSPGRAF